MENSVKILHVRTTCAGPVEFLRARKGVVAEGGRVREGMLRFGVLRRPMGGGLTPHSRSSRVDRFGFNYSTQGQKRGLERGILGSPCVKGGVGVVHFEGLNQDHCRDRIFAHRGSNGIFFREVFFHLATPCTSTVFQGLI